LINPYPLFTLNHFTTPVTLVAMTSFTTAAALRSPDCCCLSGEDDSLAVLSDECLSAAVPGDEEFDSPALAESAVTDFSTSAIVLESNGL